MDDKHFFVEQISDNLQSDLDQTHLGGHVLSAIEVFPKTLPKKN